MVKIIFIAFLLIGSLKANIYEQNCVSCHKKLPVSIDKFFYRYLLKYSSKKDVTLAMFSYLKEPKAKKSVMLGAFIKRFGVKETSNLSEKQLKNAIDIYWEKYKVFGKLK